MNKVVTLITLGVLISKSVEAQIVMVKDIANDFPISNVTIEGAISSAIKTDTQEKTLKVHLNKKMKFGLFTPILWFANLVIKNWSR